LTTTVAKLTFAAWRYLDLREFYDSYPNSPTIVTELDRHFEESGCDDPREWSASQDHRGFWLFVCARNGNDDPTQRI
jgi:hypothetical protein